MNGSLVIFIFFLVFSVVFFFVNIFAELIYRKILYSIEIAEYYLSTFGKRKAIKILKRKFFLSFPLLWIILKFKREL